MKFNVRHLETVAAELIEYVPLLDCSHISNWPGFHFKNGSQKRILFTVADHIPAVLLYLKELTVSVASAYLYFCLPRD